MIQQLDQSGMMDSLISVEGKADMIFENFDLKAKQMGVSFMMNYDPGEKFNVKLYGTYQQTKLSGKTEIEYKTTGIQIIEANDHTRTMKMNSFTNPTQWSPELTPSFYGGFYLNYKPGNSWNFSTDAYIYSNQRFSDVDSNNIVADFTGNFTNDYMDIKANMVLNAKASYRINKNTTSYVTIKNILGEHREFGFADQISRLFMIGIKWEL